MKKLITPTLAVIAIISLIVNFLLHEQYSTSKAIVHLGSASISKKAYIDALEFQYGKQTLNKLVYAQLVNDAAAKAGVAATDADVKARVDEIKRRDPAALKAVTADPVKMGVFQNDLRSDINLENLRIQNVSASPAEVAAFYQHNPRLFIVPMQVQTTMVVSHNQVYAGTAESLLSQGMSPDVISRTDGLSVVGVNGFQVNMDRLSAADHKRLSQMVFAMKPGEVKSIAVGGVYLTLKVKKAEQTSMPPLASIRPKVERDVKLLKAVSPTQELAKLYTQANPKFDIESYQGDFSDIESYIQQHPEIKSAAK